MPEWFEGAMGGGEWRINGFPDAAKFIALDTGDARRLADLTLHLLDLRFALDCLEAINRVPVTESLIREALWRCAIVHFFKCFGHSDSRSSLDSKKVWKGESVALEVFAVYKDFRDKHLVHDENSWTQCEAGAVLNKRDDPRKIAKVITPAFSVMCLSPEWYGQFRRLVETAREWVHSEYDRLADAIARGLESQPYDELLARGLVTFNRPETEDLGRPRRRAGSSHDAGKGKSRRGRRGSR